jgi:cysteine desulfuration protein SufE|tara:strand:- start:4571 stop:4978 length:408 start_codon:yes stop_codon:yes gene_type:complete
MTAITEKIEYWGANLKLLEGMDRFQYIIEQARNAKPMKQEYKIKEFQIHGCASKLWVVPEIRQDRLFLTVDSDAFITKGTAAIIADIFDGQSCREISLITKEDIAKLGIIEILTPQRQNGLSNMITTIKRYADLK